MSSSVMSAPIWTAPNNNEYERLTDPIDQHFSWSGIVQSKLLIKGLKRDIVFGIRHIEPQVVAVSVCLTDN